MTNKIRLEEIKTNAIVDKVHFKYINNSKGYWGKTYTLIDDDMQWLVEQAERVQELESKNKLLKSNLSVVQGYYKNMIKINKDIVEQNQRYRELISEIHFQASLVETSDNVDDAIMEAIKALEELK